jgi:selenocysteine lyase/cysteine desulfurase
MGRWTRRDFLTRAGALAGAATLGAACSGDEDDAAGDGASDGDGGSNGDRGGQAADFDPQDWGSVRDQFPLTPDLRHFAAFVLAAHPRPVADAIERYRDALATDTHGALDEYGGQEEVVRSAAAEYLGADASEIALTDSTTMGLGLVYGGIELAPGDEVLTTEHDFFSTHESLRLRTERDGTVVRRVALYDDPASASVDQVVSRFTSAITPATRVAAVTWVHSGTGVKLPIAAMAEALAGVNDQRPEGERVLLCVDGVHGFGLEPVTGADLGCDFLVSGAHKWLWGPHGTGLVWGRPTAWGRLDPLFASFSAPAPPADPGGPAGPGLMATPGGYHAFEHRWALDEAFSLAQAIGKDEIHRRTVDQATTLKEGLGAIEGLTVVTPVDPELSAGIVCVGVVDGDPFSLIAPLRDQGIVASITPYDVPYLRLGPSIVTTPDDVEAAVSALGELAR